jgi:hypothetical protein
MGNSGSSNAGDCYIHINDNATTYTAGSTISGVVRCCDRSDRRNSKFNRDALLARGGIKLCFVGEEDVAIASGGGGGGKDGGFVTNTKAAKRDIVRADIPMDGPTSTTGDALASFQFQIPHHLPSTMFFKDKSGGHCSIRYRVMLMRSRRGRGGGTPHPRGEVRIDLVAKPTSTTPMPHREEHVQRMSLLRCIPRGCVSWSADVLDSRVGVGENLTVNLDVANNSRTGLRVAAVLEETVAWRISRRRSRTVSRTYDPQNFESSNIAEDDNRVALTFHVPDYACQTYSGRLVTIQHRVRIEAREIPPFHTRPGFRIPIEVVCPRVVHTPTWDIPIATAMLAPMPATVPPATLGSDHRPSAPVVAARANGIDTDASKISNLPTPRNPYLRTESDSDSERSSHDDLGPSAMKFDDRPVRATRNLHSVFGSPDVVAPSAPPYESRPSAMMMVGDRANAGIEAADAVEAATAHMPSAPPLPTKSDREYEFGRPLNRVIG